MSSVRSSPLSISGPSFHQLALSISEKSRTTSQSSSAIASRCIAAFAEPTAGFSPMTKYPRHVPFSISSIVSYVLWSPVSRGR